VVGPPEKTQLHIRRFAKPSGRAWKAAASNAARPTRLTKGTGGNTPALILAKRNGQDDAVLPGAPG
jgi:hypothetical protein